MNLKDFDKMKEHFSKILVKYKSKDGNLNISGHFFVNNSKDLIFGFAKLLDIINDNNGYEYFYTLNTGFSIYYSSFEELSKDYDFVVLTLEEYKVFENSKFIESGYKGPLKEILDKSLETKTV